MSPKSVMLDHAGVPLFGPLAGSIRRAADCGAAKRSSEEALFAGADEDKIYTFGDAQQDLRRGAM